MVARLSQSGRRAAPKSPRALILAPTRELVGQIEQALAPLAKAAGLTTQTVFGGVGQNPQVQGLRRGADIVLACPGRLEDLISRATARSARSRSPCSTRPTTWPTSASCPPSSRILDQTPQQRPADAVLGDAGQRAIDVLVKRYLDQARRPRGRLGAVAGRRDGPPRAAHQPRAPGAGAGRPGQRSRAAPSSSPAPSTAPRRWPASSTRAACRPSTCTAT